MSEQNQQTDSLKDIHDIRQIMERSSRFISLSGLSGISAGVCALVACYVAHDWIRGFLKKEGGYFNPAEVIRGRGYGSSGYTELELNLFLLAGSLLAVAVGLAYFFTWRRARKNHQSLWNFTTRKLLWNMLVPLVAGGLFTLALLEEKEWGFIAPGCLLFYGLALVNASKYTVSDIRYLGYCEIILGLVNTQFPGYGLYFWAFGFGILHIVYGAVMWWKYERA